MDRFVNRQNIERYRRLADETTNATERLRVIKLLAEEGIQSARCHGAPRHGMREAVRA
jgi:hypothetical protein